MGQIRPFIPDHIPQVVGLYQRVHRHGDGSLRRELESYLSQFFFQNPWVDHNLPSLVYQENGGQIIGFLGVVPRPMSINGRPLRVAFGSHFMVDPGRRSSLAGLQLLRTFLSGPQDLSMGDTANDTTHKVWRALGGVTARLYSMSWTRPLRPSLYGLHAISLLRKTWPTLFARAASPLGRLLDSLAVRMPQSPFHQSAPPLRAEELSAETLLRCIAESSSQWSLGPEYDLGSLQWLLEFTNRRGNLQKVVLRHGEGKIVGWYLYLQCSEGISQVIQIGAHPDSIDMVLDHLFYRAWRRGSLAVHGRVDPRFMRQFSSKHCLFYCPNEWVLIHSQQPDVLRAIHRGDAFMTRLEGEWGMAFAGKDFMCA